MFFQHIFQQCFFLDRFCLFWAFFNNPRFLKIHHFFRQTSNKSSSQTLDTIDIIDEIDIIDIIDIIGTIDTIKTIDTIDTIKVDRFDALIDFALLPRRKQRRIAIREETIIIIKRLSIHNSPLRLIGFFRQAFHKRRHQQ